MTNRSRGDAFERRCRKHLDEHGYTTLRSSGSSGPFDVLALRKREVLLVQCKIDGRLDPHEWDNLLRLAQDFGAVPLLAQRTGRAIEYRRLWMPKGWTPEQRDGEPLWHPWAPVLDVGW